MSSAPAPALDNSRTWVKKMISKKYKSYKTLFTVTARMTETRITVRTQQRPTTRTLVKWAWRKTGNKEQCNIIRNPAERPTYVRS